jgi:hypothetical protein
MNSLRTLRGFLACLSVVLLVAVVPAPPPADAATPVSIRPIEDFLGAQGSTSIFIPPIPDFVGWYNNPFTRFASVDYAGVASAWLVANGGPDVGTTTSGSVVERKLKDGRVLVTVVLHTRNAISWSVPFDADMATGPLEFGWRATDLLADPSRTPALSTSECNVSFINTGPGAPLPDLISFLIGTTLPGQELRSLSIRTSGDGPLHEVFGVAEGTPGRMIITQSGLFFTQFQGATGDGFPVERVDLHPLQ